ncbi:MAG: alpha/beta hydrolase [Desulfobacteraceae bacterium]|nr:MAG: alpha/beta hydrolase [Desulfobacteraceae bacterium]
MLKIVAIALLAYAAYCGLLFVAQRQVLFPRYMIPDPGATDTERMGIEVLWLEASFGKVEAWFLPPANGPAAGPAPAVIFAHGNGELIDFWPLLLERFARMGIGLLLVEYPGYGRSAGSPSQATMAETFTLAYDRLMSRPDVDPARIVLFGRSLGGGAVCDLTLTRPARALILMSCFTSVRAFAIRYLAPAFLIRDPLDNLAAVRRFEHPVLVIHGRSDEVIPFGHGQALAAAAPNGRMIAYDAGHNDCPRDWELFWRDVEIFLSDAGVLPQLASGN